MEPRKLLMNYALKLLGGRRYTTAGLQKKLNEKIKKLKLDASEDARSSEDTARVIERLKELRLLDDGEYANLYIEDQLRSKPQGTRMLKMRMAAKGLPKDIIGRALANYEAAGGDETKLARAAAAKKLKTLGGLPPQKKKEKLARFLAARGFGTRSIMAVVGSSYADVEDSVD